MKKAITYIAVSLCLGLWGCLHEKGLEQCPADMTLSFYLDDIYDPGTTYDDRIANDVQLYVFSHKKCVAGIRIPYSEISYEQLYTLRKTPEMDGEIDLVAWAVPVGSPEGRIPQWGLGEEFDDELISEELYAEYSGYYRAITHELYLGRASFTASFNEPSHQRIGMVLSVSRVEVYVSDPNGTIYDQGAQKYAIVKGVMSQMDMDMHGVGEPANVVARLNSRSGDPWDYATDRFGVLPSSDGQLVSIDIRSINHLFATLSVPKDELPHGAWAGGLIIFEYTLGSNYFTIIINGWRKNIYNVDGI